MIPAVPPTPFTPRMRVGWPACRFRSPRAATGSSPRATRSERPGCRDAGLPAKSAAVRRESSTVGEGSLGGCLGTGLRAGLQKWTAVWLIPSGDARVDANRRRTPPAFESLRLLIRCKRLSASAAEALADPASVGFKLGPDARSQAGSKSELQLRVIGTGESNRVSQRLQMLRRWSHGQEKQVRTRSA